MSELHNQTPNSKWEEQRVPCTQLAEVAKAVQEGVVSRSGAKQVLQYLWNSASKVEL